MRGAGRWLLVWAALVGCSDYELTGQVDDKDAPIDTEVESVGPPTGDTGEPVVPCEDFSAPSVIEPTVDETCINEPEPGSFDPVVEWTTEGTITYSTGAGFKHPYVMPAVANLTDDNGDGVVDEYDIPDIAYTAFSTSDTSQGWLHVVQGDGSGEVLSLGSVTIDGVDYAPSRFGGVALGDLEGDGLVDIVFVSQVGAVVAVEADGTGKWAYDDTLTSTYSYPSLADLEGDGDADVVVGQIILDSEGGELGVGTDGIGVPDSNPTSWGSISIPVDHDGDGMMEVVAGNTVYAMDGSTLATSGKADGFTAIGDIDLDGEPEIVTTVHSVGQVYVWEFDGTVLWTASTGSYGGGPPTVADFDGDGEPEIGVAGKTSYTVVDADGSVLWSTAIVDASSSATGSSVFDFDADGAAEVVFADETALYVFDGATGATEFIETSHAHGTAWEYPVIVDVDADGEAEIVVGSTNHAAGASYWNGITVLGDRSGSWAPSRPVWNQHAYHITNVDNDGSIPVTQDDNWDSWNNFRAGGIELGPSHWLADLAPFDVLVCDETCAEDDEVQLYLTLGNEGLLDATSFEVGFWPEGESAPSLTEAVSSLAAGEGSVIGPFTLRAEDWGSGGLTAVVDDGEEVAECDEDDNALELGEWPCE